MNFFKEQERVRQRTRVLMIAFYSVVILTALSTAGVLYTVTEYQEFDSDRKLAFFQTSFFWTVFTCTFLYISLMSLFRVQQLKSGPHSIAIMAGAIPLPSTPIDISQKRLINIVEEISIAAGIIPPRVYIMPNEKEINAFAAGFTIHDAIIGISQGCLTKLTREELQAVVAHEIGHIVSGDMRLNLDLIGKLYGLMSIHVAGMEIIRPRRKTYTTNSKKENSELGGFILGATLIVVGFIGHFMALLLKLAISRGQEFNADAKSVQFTRNPAGLAGALKKILAVKESFKVQSAKKDQLSHLYFFYPDNFFDFLSTHPPLEIRIQKIDPSFRPSFFARNEITQFRNMLNGDISMLIEKSFSQNNEVQKSYVLENDGDHYDQTLAFYYLISGNSSGINAGNIRYYYDKLKKLSPNDLVKEMDIILGRLRTINETEIRSILKKVKEIILEDKVVLPSEVLCFTLFKEVLLPTSKIASKIGLKTAKSDVIIVMSYLAIISSDGKDSQEKSFAIGMNEIYPQERFEFVPRSSLSDINNSFEKLKDIIPLGRERIYKAAMKAISNDQKENFNEIIFLKVLSQIMGIPSEEN
jgi:Zn-dependent protease with chaperone function